MNKIILISNGYERLDWLNKFFKVHFVDMKNSLSYCLNKFDCDYFVVNFDSTSHKSIIENIAEYFLNQKIVITLCNNSTTNSINKDFKNVFEINTEINSTDDIRYSINKIISENRISNKIFSQCYSLNNKYQIAQLTLKGEVLSYNNYFFSALKYSEEDLTLFDFKMLLSDSSKIKFEEVINSITVLENSQALFLEFLSSKKNKIPFEIFFEYIPPDNLISVYCNKTPLITEMIKALIESEKKYKKIFDLAQEGIWIIDDNAYTTMVNNSMAKMLGYEVDEMIGRHLYDFMDNDGIKIAEKNLARRKSGIAEQHDFEFKHKSGEPVYTAIETSPILDDEKKYIGAIAGIIDITKKKKIEFELIESLEREKLLNWVVKDSPIGIVSFSPSGELLSHNNTYKNIIDQFGTKITGLKHFAKNIFPELETDFFNLSKSDNISTSVFETKITNEIVAFEIITKAFYNSLNQVIAYTAFITDISEIIKAEKKLQLELEINKTVARLSKKITSSETSIHNTAEYVLEVSKELTNADSGYITLINEKNGYETVLASDLLQNEKNNPALSSLNLSETIYGYSKKIKNSFHTNDPVNFCNSHKLIETNPEVKNFLSVPAIINGEFFGQISVINKSKNFSVDDIIKIKQIVKIYSLAIQRKQFEDEQKHLQNVLQDLINEIYIIDIDEYIFKYVNNSFLHNLGYSEQEALALSPSDIYNSFDQEKFSEVITPLVNKMETKISFETHHTRKDETKYPVEVTLQFVEHGNREEILATAVDITDKKLHEKQRIEFETNLRQQQKLEAIGMLASGVAHEINNPLMGIINYAELINRRTDDEKFKTFSRGIINEGQRVAKIVKNLLSFARRENDSTDLVDIKDLINSTIILIGTSLRKDNINIEFDYSDNLLPILCKTQQIQQVFINLLQNSQDALKVKFSTKTDSKKVTISVHKIILDQTNHIQIIFEDNGTGIEKEKVKEIFDPFYTTKPKEQGTGLGLSICSDIINEHNGKIECESKLNKYTRFTITLPAKEDN